MPFLDYLPFVGDLIGTLAGNSAQRSANRTNIKLQREQQEWESMMSNTAVQRRVKDITAAGGNPALAFTGGQEASTPSIAPARVESEFQNQPNFTAKALAKAQIDNIRADTQAKTAEAMSKGVEARIAVATELGAKDVAANRNVQQYEWDRLKTKILQNTETSTGLEARKLQETTDSMIQMAKQQARAGKLDLDALENLAKVGGLEAGKAQGIIKLIIDLLKD